MKLFQKIHLDPAGCGSNASTLEEAKNYDKTITLQDIKDWKYKNTERKTNLKGFNSFIAEKPFQEFQIDLFFLPDLKKDDFEGGLLFIGIFTKYVVVIPIHIKQPEEILQALKMDLRKWEENLKLCIQITKEVLIVILLKNI